MLIFAQYIVCDFSVENVNKSLLKLCQLYERMQNPLVMILCPSVSNCMCCVCLAVLYFVCLSGHYTPNPVEN